MAVVCIGKSIRPSLLALAAAFVCHVASYSEALAADVKRYDVKTISFSTSGSYSNPYMEVDVQVTFQGPTQTLAVDGFWDGGATFRARVAPMESGLWTYTATSSDPGIDNQAGSFNVLGEMGGLNGHGHIEINPLDKHKFQYTDGTAFVMLGHSLEWSRQSDFSSGEFQTLVSSRSQQGFTMIVGYGGPGLHKLIFAENEGGLPFLDTSALTQLNPAHYQATDERLLFVQEQGLAVNMALSFADQNIFSLNRTLLQKVWRYVIARYAAYPIVWQPISEFDEGPLAATVAFGELTRDLDPYNHPQSMHPTDTSASLASYAWYDFIIHQIGGTCADYTMCANEEDGKLAQEVALIRSEYSSHNMPIFQQEYRATRPDFVRRSAWRHYMNGAYFTLTSANFVVSDQRTADLAHLMKFFSQTNYNLLRPDRSLVSNGDALVRADKEIVVYLATGGSVSVDLAAMTGAVSVTWYNPRTGRFSASAPTQGGATEIFNAPDSSDWILHLSADAIR